MIRPGGQPAPPSILMISAAPGLTGFCRPLLAEANFAVREASSAAEARRSLEIHPPRAVLLDLGLPGREAPPLLRELLTLSPGLPVLVLDDQPSVDNAVRLMQAGAFDVIPRPFEAGRLLESLRSALSGQPRAANDGARRPVARLDTQASPPRLAGPEAVGFIGASAAMAQIHATIAAIAGSNATVFITGESGTGKELAAHALHAGSGRATGPFIALNCGAIPPDLAESEVFGHVKGSFTGAIADKPGAALAADGGTLFLDEICEMPPALQTKFLRFLQTSTVQQVGATRPREVDIRIICATNRDPAEAVRRGQFREDLFYRLHVVPLHMPPLRARDRDVIEIARDALRRFGLEEGKVFNGFSAETESILMRRTWRGNVRQLLNVVRNVAVLCPGGLVTPEMLPPEQAIMAGPAPANPAPTDTFAGLTLAQLERQAIEAALMRHGGSVPRAAHALDIAASTLYRKLESWRDRQEAAG